MYSFIKKWLFGILPRETIFKFELPIRRFIYFFYRGDKFACNICDANLMKFFIQKDGSKICPKCGSLGRHRRLWELLTRRFLSNNSLILDFSPSRCLYRELSDMPHIKYLATDMSVDFISNYSYDITNIDLGNDMIDLSICYHVLEHVENDTVAISELYRITKPNGIVLVQTPFKSGEIFEDSRYTTSADRKQHFGQEDHVRIYSVEGLVGRLGNAGFNVSVLEFEEAESNYLGFKTVEQVIVCRK
jgi:predicted SAM-dependent methyltransferase